MRLAVSFLLACPLIAADMPYFSVLSDNPGAWPTILSSVGFFNKPAAIARIFVARTGTPGDAAWRERIEKGAILILEGESSLAQFFGFRPTLNRPAVRVRSVTDVHRPDLRIIWEKSSDLPFYELPTSAQVFAKERWSGAPLCAGFRSGSGAVLWIATSPGEKGYEQFPYLLNALVDLGVKAPLRSDRLWAFFDGAYRTRVDLAYLAKRWRMAGISALQIAAWRNFETGEEQDSYIRNVIDVAHREGILVYAWLELPHVSDRFWDDHPEWREKTAIGQDAQLDWRKLMNLTNRDCFRAVSAGVRSIVERFDWDGVNLAELYFESLEGPSNPSRFTPFNSDVRLLFKKKYGVDPVDRIDTREFLAFRSNLVHLMQEEWLDEMEKIRKAKPYLDLVLTHIDDRFDTSVRVSLGVDVAETLPLLEKHEFTLLIEDPATVWHLGPSRYREIAERYTPLTRHRNKLAIDLNIVERYQNVYPTKQQTGVELFQLVHAAASNFSRTALYFENSLLPPDLKLLPNASAIATKFEQAGNRIVIEAPHPVGVAWFGPARVDGVAWPIQDEGIVWLPAGSHAIEPGGVVPCPAVLRLNANLVSARCVDPRTTEFTYQSQTRAIALVEGALRAVRIDGEAGPRQTPLMLPPGQHVVSIETSRP